MIDPDIFKSSPNVYLDERQREAESRLQVSRKVQDVSSRDVATVALELLKGKGPARITEGFCLYLGGSRTVTYKILATGDSPISYGIDNNVFGLTCDPVTGIIRGIIDDTNTGSFTVTIRATNSKGEDTRVLTILYDAIPVMSVPAVVYANKFNYYSFQPVIRNINDVSIYLLSSPDGMPKYTQLGTNITKEGFYGQNVLNVSDNSMFISGVIADEPITIGYIARTPSDTRTAETEVRPPKWASDTIIIIDLLYDPSFIAPNPPLLYVYANMVSPITERVIGDMAWNNSAHISHYNYALQRGGSVVSTDDCFMIQAGYNNTDIGHRNGLNVFRFGAQWRYTVPSNTNVTIRAQVFKHDTGGDGTPQYTTTTVATVPRTPTYQSGWIPQWLTYLYVDLDNDIIEFSKPLEATYSGGMIIALYGVGPYSAAVVGGSALTGVIDGHIWRVPEYNDIVDIVVSDAVGSTVTIKVSPTRVIGYSVMRFAYARAHPVAYGSVEDYASTPIRVPAGITKANVVVYCAAERRPYAGSTFIDGSVVLGGTAPVGDTLDQYWLDVFSASGTRLYRYWLNYQAYEIFDGLVISNFSLTVEAGWEIHMATSASDGISSANHTNNSRFGILFRPVPSVYGSFEAGVVVTLVWST